MSTTRSNANLNANLEEKIRFRAYELYLHRGADHGRALDDWLQAEAELLRSKLGATPIESAPAKRVRSSSKRNGK
ncbi:MAG: DUF2934 domain-containing protein [Acidobacteriia bacterium]|nr:DUF2934 domain-containing protein [Terriglobia bacterium]